MIGREIRAARARRGKRAIEAHLESEGVEPITTNDLRIIKLALETHERTMTERHGADSPASIAARSVRAKIARNER